MTMSTETQESKAAEWLKWLREAEAAEETLVEYTGRLGLRLGEATDGSSICDARANGPRTYRAQRARSCGYSRSRVLRGCGLRRRPKR
jgi:hypothetical protein